MASAIDFDLSRKKDFNEFTVHNKFIGKGAFGEVYGPCNWENKTCAIKRRLFDMRASTSKTQKEIMACNKWKSLRHPNLITVWEVNFEVNVLHVVMEYAEGGSLYDALRSLQSDLPYDISRNWATQIANGMDCLHGNSIVHRDLKSPNIVIMEKIKNDDVHGKILKITDFDQIREHDHTTEMSAVGTYRWMAPEVIGQGLFSKASDVWSFGVVLWEILTRKIPYDGMEGYAVANEVKNGKLMLEVPTSYPYFFKRLLQRCFNYDSKERPSFSEIPSAVDDQRCLEYEIEKRPSVSAMSSAIDDRLRLWIGPPWRASFLFIRNTMSISQLIVEGCRLSGLERPKDTYLVREDGRFYEYGDERTMIEADIGNNAHLTLILNLRGGGDGRFHE